MKPTKSDLDQLNEAIILTDGGIETTLIFQQGIDLPHFAAFDLLSYEEGKMILRNYYLDYINVAKKYQVSFLLESPTWRANFDWGYKMGYSHESLNRINRIAIEQLQEIKSEFEDGHTNMIISGCVGPRGDGYAPDNQMEISEAEIYHSPQIQTFKKANADMVSAITMNYVQEALGITNAAKNAKIPVVISFTVETDGRLPSGQLLKEAIEEVDRMTESYPDYYMINCAHPSHFDTVLKSDGKWLERIQGIRANASKKSHAELDESEHLDRGDKHDLAKNYQTLHTLLPNLKVVGGCCGTDHTHVEEICKVFV